MYQQILQKQHIRWTSIFFIINSFFSEISIAHNLFHSTSGAKYGEWPCFCGFLLVHLCQNASVSFYLWFSKQPRWFGAKESVKNVIFNAIAKLWKCSGNMAATLYIVHTSSFISLHMWNVMSIWMAFLVCLIAVGLRHFQRKGIHMSFIHSHHMWNVMSIWMVFNCSWLAAAYCEGGVH